MESKNKSGMVSIAIVPDTDFHEMLIMEERKRDKKVYDAGSTAELVDGTHDSTHCFLLCVTH